jgi:hypothetical protein
LPKKKLMTASVPAAMAARRRGVLERWAFLVDHFLECENNRGVAPSILQMNSTVFRPGEIVETPDSVFLGNKKTAAANPFSSRS